MDQSPGWTPPTKVAGTLRRAARNLAFAGIPSERHMECTYYFDFRRLCLNEPFCGRLQAKLWFDRGQPFIADNMCSG